MTTPPPPTIPKRRVNAALLSDRPGAEPATPDSLEDALSASGLDILQAQLDEDGDGGRPRAIGGQSLSRIELFSAEAQRLWIGRAYDPDRPSLRSRPSWEEFRRKARFVLISAVRHDDPYAFLCLLRLDDQLGALDERHSRHVEQLEALLRVHRQDETARPGKGLQVVEPATSRFTSKTFWVTAALNPYAGATADQISVFDHVVSLLLTARDCGRIDKQLVEKVLGKERRAFAQLFETTRRFRPSGITRRDVVEGLAKVGDAVAKYGEIPLGVIDGSLRPRYAPVDGLALDLLDPDLGDAGTDGEDTADAVSPAADQRGSPESSGVPADGEAEDGADRTLASSGAR